MGTNGRRPVSGWRLPLKCKAAIQTSQTSYGQKYIWPRTRRHRIVDIYARTQHQQQTEWPTRRSSLTARMAKDGYNSFANKGTHAALENVQVGVKAAILSVLASYLFFSIIPPFPYQTPRVIAHPKSSLCHLTRAQPLSVPHVRAQSPSRRTGHTILAIISIPVIPNLHVSGQE